MIPSPRWLGRTFDRAAFRLSLGRSHRRLLDDLDVRIAVTGTRGKTTMVEWLYEALTARNYDTYAKTTGEVPTSHYDGESHEIDRSGQVTLYENAREIRKYDPDDAIVVENQGIRGYTMRLVNERYVDPTVVVLTNVRLDHLDTLGTDYPEIARAFVRSIPPDTRVISGERNPAVAAYLRDAFERNGVSFTQAVSPDAAVPVPGAEFVPLVNAVMATLDAPSLSVEERDRYLSRLDVSWRRLPGGRIYSAADANDVDSTELIRRALLDYSTESIRVLMYFRRDRPGRTASYVDYFDELWARDLLSAVHLVGDHRQVASRKLDAPVVTHDADAESAGDLLDAVLDPGDPVMVVGNSVPDRVQELLAEVERRETTEREPVPEIAE